MIKTLSILAFALASNVTWAQDDDEGEDPGYDSDFSIEDQIQSEQALGPADRRYFKGSTYMNKSRQQKMIDLWSQVVPNGTPDQTPLPYYWADFPRFFTQKPNGSFCQTSDEMKPRNLKTTHTQGVVAQVEWNVFPNDLNYTGMYASGSDTVVMRLSETKNLTPQSTGLLPSMAFKFLRDERPSQNVFAMPSFTSSNSWNFFASPMRNRVTPWTSTENQCEVDTVLKKMIEGSERPFGTAIYTIGKHTNEGGFIRGTRDVAIPYELEFRASSEVQSLFSDEKELDSSGNQVMFYDQLKRIPEGTNILEVYALTVPLVLGGIHVKIADIKLKTSLVTSRFGDERLYFQHRRISRDRRYWTREVRNLEEDPFFENNATNNWGQTVPDTWPQTETEAENFYVDQVTNFGCPFAWLLN